MQLTQAILREQLHYDEATGVFTRLRSLHHSVKVGDVAGSVTGEGYRTICVFSTTYKAHRLAFLYMTGEWPKGEVDHRDGERDHNAWANLRDVPKYANMQNLKRARSDSTTGLIGVSPNGSGYTARITLPGHKKKTNLGTFQTPEEAHAAYLKAKRELHEGCTI